MAHHSECTPDQRLESICIILWLLQRSILRVKRGGLVLYCRVQSMTFQHLYALCSQAGFGLFFGVPTFFKGDHKWTWQNVCISVDVVQSNLRKHQRQHKPHTSLYIAILNRTQHFQAWGFIISGMNTLGTYPFSNPAINAHSFLSWDGSLLWIAWLMLRFLVLNPLSP